MFGHIALKNSSKACQIFAIKSLSTYLREFDITRGLDLKWTLGKFNFATKNV